MSYLLLTGATGLLGRYILRDLLKRGRKVAVMIRSTRLASARRRMDSALNDLEQMFHETLPRPLVLEGELTEPGLGLNREERRWISRHVGSVLHNAASLSFDSKGPGHEPWISNVEGTRHVLQLTRDAGIRELHYVSTAYVCGLRRDTCREDELDVGQQLGNDYERSKLAAEKMVHAADWLDGPTVYRPAIIVGDSQTYFTNTFHGFYTPLKIVDAMIPKLALHDVVPQRASDILGLRGGEQKNLVPVDWVAAVLVKLLVNRRHHGLVYHLTPTERVSVERMVTIMDLACRRFALSRDRITLDGQREGQSWTDFLPQFREQMQTYQAYWRDDPIFDKTNTLARAGEIGCPVVDDEMLLQLCRFAIEHKFWWSRGEPPSGSFDAACIFDQLPVLGGESNGTPHHAGVEISLLGSGGGDWHLLWRDEVWHRCEMAQPAENQLQITMSVDVLRMLVEGAVSPEAAYRAGMVVAQGSLESTRRAAEVVAALCRLPNPPRAVRTPMA